MTPLMMAMITRPMVLMIVMMKAPMAWRQDTTIPILAVDRLVVCVVLVLGYLPRL